MESQSASVCLLALELRLAASPLCRAVCRSYCDPDPDPDPDLDPSHPYAFIEALRQNSGLIFAADCAYTQLC